MGLSVPGGTLFSNWLVSNVAQMAVILCKASVKDCMFRRKVCEEARPEDLDGAATCIPPRPPRLNSIYDLWNSFACRSLQSRLRAEFHCGTNESFKSVLLGRPEF